jgi:hypothetical protein
MNRKFSLALLCAGLSLVVAAGLVSAAEPPSANLKYHAIAPGLSVAELLPTPTPVPTPVPYTGPVASISLESARISSQWPVEIRDTTTVGGRETFQDPSHPEQIAWYSRFGHPGFAANNSIFAAHINYINFGNGPFAYLTSAQVDDALYITMANGTVYAYSVKSVQLVSLADLQNGAIDGFVFPGLDQHTERVTLISCGGDFVARPGGGGDYTSRVILIAERYVQ